MKEHTIYKVLTVGLLFALAIPEARAINPVNPPDFNIFPDVGFYGSWIWPNAGWNLIVGGLGNINSNPAATASGAIVKRTGMYSVTGSNIVEAWCAPNYYWIYQGYGVQPFNWIYQDVSATPTNGNCYFNVTIGNQLRQPIVGAPKPPLPRAANSYPRPAPTNKYTFDVVKFANNVKSALNAGTPAPVGFQLAVRDPQGKLVYSTASGSVTGAWPLLPATPMTTNRRFDTASMSKTITATAIMAAMEDLGSHKPALGITLDSSILPFLPNTWHPKPSVANVTFRSLLRHTAGFCYGGPPGDSYDAVRTMVENGPESSWVGHWNYCNSGYALLRILLAYLVDGPVAFQPYEWNSALNAQITALSYRNYVRGKIFDPIGLSGVDEFYTGPLPETIYFDKHKVPIPDDINIPGFGYHQLANDMVLTAGSGNWTISAEEYSLFISSLWLGKIISQSSVNAMLGLDDPNSIYVGIGMYASRLIHGQNTFWDYNEAGGGGYDNGNGGPEGIWITFFNGYTAVLLSNTAWGLPGTMAYELMESCFAPALTP